jgi:spermidine synthase
MSFRIDTNIRISLFALGFASVFTQIYMVREFMTVLYGNELVMAVVLSNWMVLTGLGAFIAAFIKRVRQKFTFLLFLQFIFALLPLLTTIKLDLWKAYSVPFGSMVGLSTIFLASLLLLAPFCLLNGFLFVAWSTFLAENDTPRIFGKSYALESFGSMFSGILVNFIFLWFFDIWLSLQILLILNLLVFLVNVWSTLRGLPKMAIAAMGLAMMILPFFSDLGGYCERALFPGQKLISSRETPYGKVDVTMNPGQINVFENGLLLFSSGNEIFNEEAVHFGMIQHPDPKNILLVSGGISGMLREIVKYHPQRVDYLEMNPALIKTGLAFSTVVSDPAIRVIAADARGYLNSTDTKYDVVLLNMPEPSTLQVNRFFTIEFFRLLADRLNPGAVVSLHLPSTADYVSRNEDQLNSSLFATLHKVFNNVLILPGQKNYFICSDSMLHSDVASMTGRRRIETKYVNEYYLDDDLIQERSRFITSHLSMNSGINQDLQPLGFFLQLRQWNAFFGDNFLIPVIGFLVLLIILGLTVNPVSFGLFSGGFTASSVEIILLLVLQISYGYVFQAFGVILAIFMAGLAAGSILQPRIIRKPALSHYLGIQISMAFFCLILPFVLLLIISTQGSRGVSLLTICMLTLIISFLTGMEFSVSTFFRSGKTLNAPARNYAADMLGSAIGVTVTAIFLIPLMGMVWTCVAVGFMNVLSASILRFRREKVVSL